MHVCGFLCVGVCAGVYVFVCVHVCLCECVEVWQIDTLLKECPYIIFLSAKCIGTASFCVFMKS